MCSSDLINELQRRRIPGAAVQPFTAVFNSFRFAFEALQKEDPLLAGAVLELRQPDPRYLCLDCGEACTLPQPSPEAPETQARCPACASPRLSHEAARNSSCNKSEWSEA